MHWKDFASSHASHFANSPKNSTSVNPGHSRWSSLLNLHQSVSYPKSMPPAPTLTSSIRGMSFRSATGALKNKCSYDGAFLLTCHGIFSFQGSRPPTNLWVVEAQWRSNFAWILFDLSIFMRECKKGLGDKPLGRNLLTRTPVLLYILSNGTR